MKRIFILSDEILIVVGTETDFDWERWLDLLHFFCFRSFVCIMDVNKSCSSYFLKFVKELPFPNLVVNFRREKDRREKDG